MNAWESEWAVVGGLMQDNSRLSEIDLMPADFTQVIPRMIFETVCDLIGAGEVADVITVAERLRENVPIGHITRAYENTPSSRNVVAYARNVKESSRLREGREIAESLSLGLEREGLAAVDSAIRRLMGLNQTRKSYDCTMAEALNGAIETLEEILEKGGMPGIDTGIRDLNEALGGYHSTDLIVVGARPAMGKTAFLLNAMLAADKSIGLISGEQGRSQIGLRFLSIHGKVDSGAMRTASLNEEQWAKTTAALGQLADRKVRINDHPAPSLDSVLRQARKWKFEYDIQALYVDYIQRIKVDGKGERHEQLETIVQGLKELARDLEIPVIALAQVNRNVEERSNKRPYMADLKGSGSIEQEADVIMTLFREDVYEPDPSKHTNRAEVTVLKNRHGPTLTVYAGWRPEFMRFESLERSYDE